jgi:hypothetical protein
VGLDGALHGDRRIFMPPVNRRYIEGQRQYLSKNMPQTLATFVIDYSNLANPMIVVRRYPKSN